MASDPQREGNSFVDTLVRLQDSAKILASNQQAAAEALEQVKQARQEAAEIKAHCAQLQIDAQAAWQVAADEVAAMQAKAKALKAQAEKDYTEHVNRGVTEGRRRHNAWKDRTREAEAEHSAKRAEIAVTDEELAARRKALADVKREMSHLAARLTL